MLLCSGLRGATEVTNVIIIARPKVYVVGAIQVLRNAMGGGVGEEGYMDKYRSALQKCTVQYY